MPIFISCPEVIMNYCPLSRLYHQSENEWRKEYERRYASSSCRHFPFTIHQYNHRKEWPAFLCYTEELMLLIQRIYRQHAALTGLLRQLPSIAAMQYALSCLSDEVQSTNEIEGVKSTRRDIEDILQDRPIAPRMHHLVSVVDKYAKILEHEDIPFSTCEDIRRFYDEFALEEVLQEHPDYAPDGQIFRKGPVDITTAAAKTTHRGAYPEDLIIRLISLSLQILHDESIPLLIRTAVFHYLFEYTHPFYDGNGRTGRFIVSYFLAKEFHEIIAFRFSVVVHKNKKRYYRMLADTDSEWNCGDLTPFVTWSLELIDAAFDEALTTLQRKSAQIEKFRKLLEELTRGQDRLTRTLYDLLLQAALFYGFGITMEELMRAAGKTRATIQNRLHRMPPDHLVVFTETRPYRYKLNLRLFTES